MSALTKFHSTRLSIQELLSGRIRLQRYGLFLKLKHLYPNKMQINFILATRLQRSKRLRVYTLHNSKKAVTAD